VSDRTTPGYRQSLEHPAADGGCRGRRTDRNAGIFGIRCCDRNALRHPRKVEHQFQIGRESAGDDQAGTDKWLESVKHDADRVGSRGDALEEDNSPFVSNCRRHGDARLHGERTGGTRNRQLLRVDDAHAHAPELPSVGHLTQQQSCHKGQQEDNNATGATCWGHGLRNKV
jgi:hypothetical protein